jgi:hypothetical protein
MWLKLECRNENLSVRSREEYSVGVWANRTLKIYMLNETLITLLSIIYTRGPHSVSTLLSVKGNKKIIGSNRKY